MDEKPCERTERWYREHVDAAYRLAHRVTGDAQDAADVVQAAFADILVNEHAPRSAEAERSWLMGVIWNHSMLFKRGAGRRRRRERVVMEQPRRLAPDPIESIEQGEQRDRIRACLDSLAPRDRAVLHMHYCEGLTQREIAAAMGARQGTVGSWISRASKRLETVMRRAGLAAGL
ncbi:MAG: RNA polymerase sigma factor, partial [Planctomycetota bacterium]